MDATSVLYEFMNRTENNPTVENETLLLTAYQLVKEEVVKSNYSIKSVRLAHEIYGYLGDKGLNERVELMKKSLKQEVTPYSKEDKFWANWELVDNLAILKRYKEMIKEQLLFLEWTKLNMEPENLLNVMYDSTQAVGWVNENQDDLWFQIYNDLISIIKPTKQNRFSRVLYVETAAGLFAYNLKKYNKALIEVERYKDILLEDKLWSEYTKFSIRRISYLLEIYNRTYEMGKYENVVNEAISNIEIYLRQYNQGSHIDIEEICDMAHEIGTSLMWHQRYPKAMELFEYAIKYQGTGITHFFYAICIWATQKNREKTIHQFKNG